MNGIRGSGPMGFQAGIGGSGPGDHQLAILLLMARILETLSDITAMHQARYYGAELISCFFVFPSPFFYELCRSPHCMTWGENDDQNGAEWASVVHLIQVL